METASKNAADHVQQHSIPELAWDRFKTMFVVFCSVYFIALAYIKDSYDRGAGSEISPFLEWSYGLSVWALVGIVGWYTYMLSGRKKGFLLYGLLVYLLLDFANAPLKVIGMYLIYRSIKNLHERRFGGDLAGKTQAES